MILMIGTVGLCVDQVKPFCYMEQRLGSETGLLETECVMLGEGWKGLYIPHVMWKNTLLAYSSIASPTSNRKQNNIIPDKVWLKFWFLYM